MALGLGYGEFPASIRQKNIDVWDAAEEYADRVLTLPEAIEVWEKHGTAILLQHENR